MGLSSNLRYQVLGGVDPYVAKALPIPFFRIYQAGIRADSLRPSRTGITTCSRTSTA